ncbi:MAG: hypothetical protein KC421_11145 [Anaerolineales bacterium]|nr:hypothetical protein [Anaerolineales bacterium]
MPEDNIASIETKLGSANEQAIFYTRGNFIKQLGLHWDPFIEPVAEHELIQTARQPGQVHGTPLPLAYFVPPTGELGEEILPVLRSASDAFIFGEPGMGKTSLRLALDATCRRVPDGTLTVTYLMRENIDGVHSWESHVAHLGRELAVDLFLQVLEQFTPGGKVPTEQQIQHLGQILALGERPLHRLAQAVVQKPIPEGIMGLAHHWHKVDRLPIRHVARSPELLALVAHALDIANKTTKRLKGTHAWEFCLETARLWGFHQVFIFVDGVDTWHRTPEQMFNLIEPLLHQLEFWKGESIYGKFFLPLEMEHDILQFQSKYLSALPKPHVIDLKWDEAGLRRLLAARFRAGKARRVGFNDLVDLEWNADLDQLLLDAADGSPRRLLSLISRLIDKHVEATSADLLTQQKSVSSYNPEAFLITEKEWQQTKASN